MAWTIKSPRSLACAACLPAEWSSGAYALCNSTAVLEHRRLFDAIVAADINQAPGNNWAPTDLASLGNVAYFAANDGVHGIEPWRADGPPAGTKMVKDIAPGRGFSRPTGFA